MDYNNFGLQDFLNDDSFVQWALTGKDDAHWQQVRRTYPKQEVLIEKARGIICQLKEEADIETLHVNEEDVLRRIHIEIERQDTIPAWPEKKQRKTGALTWVAGVLLLAGVSWLFFVGKFMHPTTYKELVAEAKNRYEMTEKVNFSENPLRVKLEDGTVVTLQKNSRLSYPVHFTLGKRETFLSGEAFFEVARNPEKPFFVYANELVTKVLGTSFLVNSFDGAQQASVDVSTGQVSVFSQDRIGVGIGEDKKVVIVRNQKAVFDREEQVLSRHISDNPAPLIPQAADQRKRFQDVPVGEVLGELEELYGVKIIYNKKILASCVISTIFGNESLYDKLDVICQTIGAEHKEIDAQIVIESKGCL